MTKLTDKKLEVDRLLRIFQPEQPEIMSLRAGYGIQGELDRLIRIRRRALRVYAKLNARKPVISILQPT